MQRTEIKNFEGQDNWRKLPDSRVQLLCPRCDKWFTLGPLVDIDEKGNVLDVLYHYCDDDDDDSTKGWVVLPRLVGWKP